MNIEPNITLFLGIFGSVVTPMVIGGWAIYNRLANKIDSNRIENKNEIKGLADKIEDVRKEAKEDRNYDRQEWKHEISKIENRFERLETKLDRLVDIILMQKQNYRPHRHRNKPNKDVG